MTDSPFVPIAERFMQRLIERELRKMVESAVQRPGGAFEGLDPEEMIEDLLRPPGGDK